MTVKRDKLGRFSPGHVGLGGRPKAENLAKQPQNIDELVAKQVKLWRKQAKIYGKVPALCESLLVSAEAYFKGILALQEKESMSNTDLKMLHTLGQGLRLTVSEVHKICMREQKVADEEVEKKKKERWY